MANCRPTDAYAPWFNIVLKCARLAVAVLGMLSAESRPSRLSFNDITKRLAAASPEESAFVSPKVAAASFADLLACVCQKRAPLGI